MLQLKSVSNGWRQIVLPPFGSRPRMDVPVLATICGLPSIVSRVGDEYPAGSLPVLQENLPSATSNAATDPLGGPTVTMTCSPTTSGEEAMPYSAGLPFNSSTTFFDQRSLPS